jgi:hypothetical protein
MQHFLIAALAFTPSTVLCGGAVYLAANGLSGWGWFLLAAVCVSGSYSYNTRNEKTTSKSDAA